MTRQWLFYNWDLESMFKDIIWNDLQNLNMFENPVGNTGRPKTWKSRLINLVFLNWSKRHYWKSPISPSWGCSNIGSPLGKSMENNPTRQLSTKHPEHTTTLSKPELISNCRTVTARVGPRLRRIHLPESQQTRDLWPESAGHPWADLELPNYHRLSLQHPR